MVRRRRSTAKMKISCRRSIWTIRQGPGRQVRDHLKLGQASPVWQCRQSQEDKTLEEAHTQVKAPGAKRRLVSCSVK